MVLHHTSMTMLRLAVRGFRILVRNWDFCVLRSKIINLSLTAKSRK